MADFARAFRAAALASLLFATVANAQQQQEVGTNWRGEKCAHYGRAWTQALAHFGTAGIGHAFLDRHAEFLASGCTAPHDVCPRSPEEFKLANTMVILAMNAGTASTFPPFGCPR